MVQSREGSNLDIFNRIGARWAKCRQASGVICDKRVSHRLKRIFYKTIIRPAMLCRTDRIRNDHFSDTLKVAPTNDKMRETCLKWFCYVSKDQKQPYYVESRCYESEAQGGEIDH